MVLNSRMGCSYQHLFEHQTNTAEQEMSARGITWKEMVGKSLSKLRPSFTNFEEHARHSYTREDGCQCPPLEKVQKTMLCCLCPSVHFGLPNFSCISCTEPNCSTWCLQDKMWPAQWKQPAGWKGHFKSARGYQWEEKRKPSQIQLYFIFFFFFKFHTEKP